MPSLHDTRVLENLIKAEKTAEASFKNYTRDAASAASALGAWSVADSGDTQDLMDVSVRISQLSSSITETQRAHATALYLYRVSLKDVLAQEQQLKTVVRDREILVGKLIKLSNKKPNDSHLQTHQLKLEDAQRELTACETYLQDGEIALSHAKRQTFRVAFAERMVSLGELGRVMDQSALESHGLLVALGQDEQPENGHFEQFDPHGDNDSIAGDSITPSHSASQAMSRASSSSSLEEQAASQPHARPASRAQTNGSSAAVRATSPQRAISPTFSLTPAASAAPLDRIVARQPTVRAAPPAPRPILGPVPTAPRPVSSYLAQEAASALPSFEIPKAPTNVATRRVNDDSSDEEDARDFAAHQQNGLPRTQRSHHYPHDPPTATSYQNNVLHRRAPSENSSIKGGSRVGKRRNSIFGGLASLFRRKEKTRVDDSAARLTVMGDSSWNTRIDRHVYTAQKGANGAGRASSVAANRLRPGNDSSDDEPSPKNLIRVVNDPKARVKAMSDIGRSKPPSVHTVATEPVKRKKTTKRVGRAASDVGAISPSTMPINYPSAPFLARPISVVDSHVDDTTSVKKKKKKATNGEGAATIVLSAEKLGIPTGNVTAARPGKLSRSSTNASYATAATAVTTTTATTVKKKKKRIATDGTVPAVPSPLSAPVPTALDLASSLPSARGTVYDSLTSPLPLPNGETTPRSSPALGGSSTTSKVPKALAESSKRSKREAALHSNSTWVSQPAKKAGHDGEGQESIMSVVDRAEAEAVAEPSRKYGSTNEGLAVPRGPLPNAGSLTKRKSVRLAEGDEVVPQHPLSSPASSIRSGQGAAPRHGILINNSNAAASNGQVGSDVSSSGWNTRVTASRVVDDSSDEDEDAVAYRQARKAFSKALKDKGKGKAVE